MRRGILAGWAQLVWKEDDSEEEVDGSNKQIGRVDVEGILKSHCIHEDINSTQSYTRNILFIFIHKRFILRQRNSSGSTARGGDV